jgi:hypothetical protein
MVEINHPHSGVTGLSLATSNSFVNFYSELYIAVELCIDLSPQRENNFVTVEGNKVAVVLKARILSCYIYFWKRPMAETQVA